MKHRLYVPELKPPVSTGDRLVLTEEQAHYLNRVLRLRIGAEVGLFDGRGQQWMATLRESRGRRCEVEILELSHSDPAPRTLILAQSWLKGAATDRVVQKATELGATAIWLLSAERSNVRLDEHRLATRLAHLKKVSISAAEQCGARWLPDLEGLAGVAEALENVPAIRCLMLDLDKPVLETGRSPQPLLLLIGPEGGWTDAERAIANRHDQLAAVSLGDLILRAETAPIAAIAAIRHSWGWCR